MAATSVKLIYQLRDPTAHSAWERFIELYTPLVFSWSYDRGLNATDAADLVQDVLLTILQRIHEFDPDGTGRFRSWLKTITANRITDFYRRQQVRREIEPTSSLALLAKVSEAELWDDQQYQLGLVTRTLELLRDEFQEGTWKAGYAQLVEGKSAREVASSLGISVNAAYIAKSRLLGRVREQLDGLLD